MACLTVFFLHRECGYHFDRHGCLWGLTGQEMTMLWEGFGLWQEHVKGAKDDKKPGQRATDGDHDAFDKFVDGVNT